MHFNCVLKIGRHEISQKCREGNSSISVLPVTLDDLLLEDSLGHKKSCETMNRL